MVRPLQREEPREPEQEPTPAAASTTTTTGTQTVEIAMNSSTVRCVWHTAPPGSAFTSKRMVGQMVVEACGRVGCLQVLR
eukprot:178393-Amphidinium_carterae.1